jgi:hypothetical protein
MLNQHQQILLLDYQEIFHRDEQEYYPDEDQHEPKDCFFKD